MPTISDPFVANVPRTMSNDELAQAIRVDLASELEATLLYEAHAAATEDELARTVLKDIANEEKEHMGELLALLQHLSPSEGEHFAEGADEVKEMMSELGLDPKDEEWVGDNIVFSDERVCISS